MIVRIEVVPDCARGLAALRLLDEFVAFDDEPLDSENVSAVTLQSDGRDP